MSRNDLLARFQENAAKAAAVVRMVDAPDKWQEIISGIMPPADPVFCPGATELEKKVLPLLKNRTPDYPGAAVTIEEVYGGIAETGSLICSSAAGKALQASLLPGHHIAIVPQKKIFATLDDFFASCAAHPPTNITIITGPSRTADIELTLAIGVHGPERLDIILYREN